jgi:septal ring factor EnvC (AmiA/AmiB activator)
LAYNLRRGLRFCVEEVKDGETVGQYLVPPAWFCEDESRDELRRMAVALYARAFDDPPVSMGVPNPRDELKRARDSLDEREDEMKKVRTDADAMKAQMERDAAERTAVDAAKAVAEQEVLRLRAEQETTSQQLASLNERLAAAQSEAQASETIRFDTIRTVLDWKNASRNGVSDTVADLNALVEQFGSVSTALRRFLTGYEATMKSLDEIAPSVFGDAHASPSQ